MADDFPNHRPNVGVVLFNRDGRVWYGRRVGYADSWQFPQGGVDPGEDLEAAARRELAEETGVVSVQQMGRTEGWLAYDFPADVLASPTGRGWRGQKQTWFAYRFLGEDSEIDLSAQGKPEFSAWRWGRLADAPSLIVPFKRQAYEAVVRAFCAFAA